MRQTQNDQISSNVKASSMMIRSTITTEEVLDILDAIDCEYEVTEEDDENEFWVDCSLFDINFVIFMFGQGPFFEGIKLKAIFEPELDPELMCTQFNGIHGFASATPITIQTDEVDQEDDSAVLLQKWVFLDGGVTDDHLKATIKLWAGMLGRAAEFFEGTTDDAQDISGGSVQ